MHHNFADIPGKLEPYTLDASSLGDEELIVLSMECPNLRVTHIHGQFQRARVEVNIFLSDSLYYMFKLSDPGKF